MKIIHILKLICFDHVSLLYLLSTNVQLIEFSCYNCSGKNNFKNHIAGIQEDEFKMDPANLSQLL